VLDANGFSAVAVVAPSVKAAANVVPKASFRDVFVFIIAISEEYKCCFMRSETGM
jgi:hypothetical protein